ncbi:alpha-2-macroglobulin-like isoform X2 [Ruditapes philippinarum]|uniref:alpha-2-macroglobulin-like isoform X2 n=1 Tax=Ruditapes philippinarum TaxID=129788 RepID=UPI00295A8CC2|nr:alpha-2-macroglobulin-like isoform X2 [Ruditapes philippinarum]
MFPMPFLERPGGPIAKRKKRCSACIHSDQYMDVKKMIQESGQIIVTNVDLKRQDGFDFSGTDEILFMAGAARPMESDKSLPVPDVEENVDDTDEDTGGEENKERENFPDTWIWDLVLTNSDGMYKEDVIVPDSITNWEVTAFGFNNDHGLSVSDKKEITVFQEFFISMYLPYSVVQSESVNLDILVFNYKDIQLTVTVELVESSNYTIKDKSVFSKPITIGAGTSGVQRVLVTFDKVGDIPLKAIAKDVNNNKNQDTVIRPLIVKPKGREMRDDTSLVIDMSKNTGPKEVYFNMSNFFKTPGYVPDSLRMYLYTTGDMMGTFIGLIVTKIKMPFGCGEQNIKSLTPSVVIARYLTKLNRLDEKTKGLLKKVCGVGVRKEFNYLHRDGSYSAFGEQANLCVCGKPGTKSGSTWLTAYVLMSFSLLYSDDITYIDPQTLKKSFDYIKNNATVKDCDYQYFIEKGELIHTEMKGISSSRFGFTSFITIAVMDYRLAALKAGLTDSAQEAKTLQDGAVGWLKGHQEELIAKKEPYQLAIVAYALARANTITPDVDSAALLETLENVLAGNEQVLEEEEACVYSPTSGESKRCKSDTDCGNNYMECCMVPCSNGMKKCSRKPYRPVFRNGQMSDEQSPSKSIEMNGYRMMAYLYLYNTETNSEKKATLLKKIDTLKEWLLSKRRGNGLFESTQDTVVALRALATYAMTFPNQQGADFTVTAKVDDKTVTDTVVVNDDTYTTIAEKKLDVSSPPSAVSAAVTGLKGVAYLNLVALYNVDKNVTTKPYLIDIEPRKKNDKALMRVCFSRNPEFTGDIGSMITVQMEAQTGSNILNVQPENNDSPDFSPEKYEFDKESSLLNVYYMVNSNPLDEERCLHIYYEVDFVVENVQPKEIRVSNYYSPEIASSVLYSVNPADGTELETTTVTIGASSAQINILLLFCTILVVMLSSMLQLE